MKKLLIMIVILTQVLNVFSFVYAENEATTEEEWTVDNPVIFSDTYNHWGRRYVELLKATEIISGYPDGSFRPNNTIRVDEFLVLCIKSLGVEVDTSNNDSGYWAKPFIDYGLENGLIGITFGDTERPITREEMSQIAVKTLENLEEVETINEDDLKDEINDLDFIKDKNKQAVLKAYVSGLMSGMPGNVFMPQNTATRAEASVVVLRLVDATERKPYVIEEKEVVEAPLPNTSDIPEYLQNQFDEIAEKFNLTWTDQDFENWYNSHTKDERNEFYNAVKAPPVIDFENKIALLSVHGKQSDVQEELKNLNDYNNIMPIKNFGFTAYEMYKRNIEMLVKDGEDFGKIYLAHGNNLTEVYVKVLDGRADQRQSFQVVIATTKHQMGNLFQHYLKDQYDKDKMEERLTWTTWEQFFVPYVANLTQMNYYFLHGSEEGQILYDNYVDAFAQSYYDFTATPDESLNIETENYTVKHMNEAGWWQIVTPKN